MRKASVVTDTAPAKAPAQPAATVVPISEIIQFINVGINTLENDIVTQKGTIKGLKREVAELSKALKKQKVV